MVVHTRSIHVDAPVEKVFDHLQDLHHFMSAMSALGGGGEVVDVSTAPEGVGSTATWKSRVVGIPVTGVLTCEECVSNERLVYRSSTGPVWTLTLTPDGSGTSIALTFEYHSKMPFFATVVDHVSWHPDRDLDRMLADLKGQVET